ncbi:MAG TPA: PEP-CTERM sorting domain-containing protein [Candidatus Acidoferrum sp.]|nr:PEP-CTERM sorting domain-containing protein [Candidatus Acidoferrum sp.]
MTKAWKISLFAVALLFLSVAPAAFADSATLTLTGAGSNVVDGVYVGPYTATIAGTPGSVQVICDDYTHESFVGETWNAYVSSFPGLTNVRFTGSSETQNYDEVAYLANNLFNLGGTNNPEADALQFAIWDVFDPSAIAPSTCFGAVAQDCVNYWLTAAESQSYYAGEFSNILIYTPESGGNPQEFIVRTPEPGALLLLFLGLAGLLLLKGLTSGKIVLFGGAKAC